MDLAHQANADQIAYWNGPNGQRWTDRQASQDVLLAPVSQLLIDRIGPKAGDRIVDIGCGCGATSIALAGRVAPNGLVLSVDISAPMLERARQLAPKALPLDFVQADATVYPFEPGSFDLLVSRFGVMFFADPVLSFANLRKALRTKGRVVFACWREPKENPWMMAPLQARPSTATCRACLRSGPRPRTLRFRIGGAGEAHLAGGRLHRRRNGSLRHRARYCDRTRS